MNYLKMGQPISNLDYIKQDHGPTPEPSKFLFIRDRLESNGALEKIETHYFGRTQIKYVAKREPEIDVFEKEELVIINDVLESIGDTNATELSDYTHTFIAWIFANHKENLPFYTFLLTNKDPELKDYKWADKVIKAHQKSPDA
jgi:hypothetical protein